MTARTLRASQAILASPFAVFGRFPTVVMTVIDLIADAQVRANAASEQYPLAS